MAAYCSITDVNNLVPQSPFTPTTTPSQAQVQVFINQISARIDATVSNLGYATPITGSASLGLTLEAAAWGSLGLAMQARVTSIAPDQAVGLSVWTKMFQQWIDALVDPDNPFELPDAPRTNKQVIKPLGEMLTSQMTNSVDTGTTADPNNYISSPTFSAGMKF